MKKIEVSWGKILTALFLSLIVGIAIGAFLMNRKTQKHVAASLVLRIVDSTGSLIFLEKEDVNNARDLLMANIEGDIVQMMQQEESDMDEATEDMLNAALAKFSVLRSKHRRDARFDSDNSFKMIDQYIARHGNATK
jgi:hypothetical protein